MSAGAEFFKGAPGGRGRPGNAGFKGMKGAVFICCSHHEGYTQEDSLVNS